MNGCYRYQNFSPGYLTVGMGTPGVHPASGFQLTTMIVVLVVFVIEAALAAILIHAGKPQRRVSTQPNDGFSPTI